MMKYPRTPHIRGSAIQCGDEDLNSVLFDDIQAQPLVIEEKVDGANCGISFNGGDLILQSRGHTLGGSDHHQFDLFKAWANTQHDLLYSILKDRYVMFGEWMFIKHTVFYDNLPHYFLEFDIYDKQKLAFLGTQIRRDILKGTGIISVPVLYQGEVSDLSHLTSFVRESLFKTAVMLNSLEKAAKDIGADIDEAKNQTDLTTLGEGLYIKDEMPGVVMGRYKWVRTDFIQTIKDSGSHWMGRRPIQNRLASGVDIFA